jgi:hypothetical protein
MFAVGVLAAPALRVTRVARSSSAPRFNSRASPLGVRAESPNAFWDRMVARASGSAKTTETAVFALG